MSPEFVITLLASCIGALMSVLLSIIIWELRQLRKDIKGCVQDGMCRVMMTAHEKRIEKLEREKK